MAFARKRAISSRLRRSRAKRFGSQGAKLKVSDSIAIPEFVELHIPNKDETYRAKVQWRTGFEIGVTFENEQEAPSIVPGAGPAELPEREKNAVSHRGQALRELLTRLPAYIRGP